MSILQFMIRADEILRDSNLDYSERKRQINLLRRDAMLEYRYYSPQMRIIDKHIVDTLKGQDQRAQASSQ